MGSGLGSRGRTPSPTPSEHASLQQKSAFPIMDRVKKIKAEPRILLKPRSIMWICIILVLIVLGALFYFYHTQIVHALQTPANKLKNLPGGWAIIIAIFFVISFPPLFGHEILAIVCGLVYGVWVGFAIVSAGTLIGELGNFYAFRYMCHARGEKWERERIDYGCIAGLVREGGFKIALIARYSAIPGHFTTAVFSTVGMSVWIFLMAAILSLPKQFVTVLIGTLMEANNPSTRDRIASDVVGVVTALVTVAAMWYINKEINRVKPAVIYARRKRRQAKLEASGSSSLGLSGSTLYQSGGLQSTTDFTGFSAGSGPGHAEQREQIVPLTSSFDAPPGGGFGHQQWDAQGRAVGYAGDPRFDPPGAAAASTVHAPQPQRAAVGPPSFPAPSNSLSVHATGRLGGQGQERQLSAETVRWENAVQPEAKGNYRLNSMSPVSVLDNPFGDDGEPSALPYAAPSGPPLPPPPQRFASPPPLSPSPRTGNTPKPYAAAAAVVPGSPRGKGGASAGGGGGYGFAAPQHSFGSGPGTAASPKPQKQAFSPPPGPPPGYQEDGGIR
ncbi:hypothetical protein CONPUDRAFT_109263 [Coniophora puteana RWD-64-598 SS2]|uniref:Golgi apparatus membrane protein TVP38 n=1 Tax=Coniophora puteana (strain RWD-64-598) TaxID=741705 RepID=A0A5M3MH65_CONPW|nr:uncharacterized protein CONPUDRAFT_109263 [Coniophora puteana RWD-64-598 SS2]EIW77961.1 hypothetical protein CONPUDRAFT_109263 [Coniophora puteana RWD-64-598 SS2]